MSPGNHEVRQKQIRVVDRLSELINQTVLADSEAEAAEALALAQQHYRTNDGMLRFLQNHHLPEYKPHELNRDQTANIERLLFRTNQPLSERIHKAQEVLQQLLQRLRGNRSELPPGADSDANEPSDAGRLRIVYQSDRAVVTEGNTTVEIRGARQVWVFRCVVEAAGKTVTWKDLVDADLAAAGAELERRHKKKQHRKPDVDEELLGRREPSTPKVSTNPKSLQRTGNRIRTALGKLGYHWHQDGDGACWDSEMT